MDTDMEELKDELKRQGELLEDTNRIVHKLRRNIWWGRVWNIVWWILIFIVSGAAYYYYAQPYINKLEQYYVNFQQGSSQVQTWEGQVGNFFKNLGSSATTSAQ